MDKFQYWYKEFRKSPFGIIAFALLVASTGLTLKLVDVYKSAQIELIENKKVIESQTKIILELSTQKTKFETMVELNSQFNNKYKKGRK